jgi:hypothetical protein
MGDFDGDDDVDVDDFVIWQENFGKVAPEPPATNPFDVRNCSFTFEIRDEIIVTPSGSIDATHYLIGVVPRVYGSAWETDAPQYVRLEVSNPAVEVPPTITIPAAAPGVGFEVTIRLEELDTASETVTIDVTTIDPTIVCGRGGQYNGQDGGYNRDVDNVMSLPDVDVSVIALPDCGYPVWGPAIDEGGVNDDGVGMDNGGDTNSGSAGGGRLEEIWVPKDEEIWVPTVSTRRWYYVIWY